MSSTTVDVERPVFNQSKFNDYYREKQKEDVTKCTRFMSWVAKSTNCTATQAWNKVKRRLPIISWIPKYKKEYLVGDFISGCTVAVMRIHEALAYSQLVGISPAFGLYTSLFPLFLWFMFSSSKHSSIGTNAIICLMLSNMASTNYGFGQVMQPTVDNSTESATIQTEEIDEFAVTNNRIGIVLTATFVIGVLQMILSIKNLRFMVRLISDPILHGFTCAVALLVAASQLRNILGVSDLVEPNTGVFAGFYDIADSIKSASQLNSADVVISVISLMVMIVVHFINHRYKRHLGNIPVPIELVLIIVAIVTVHFGVFNEKPLNVDIIGVVPVGIPPLVPPQYMSNFFDLMFDALPIALIACATTVQISKKFADKVGYYAESKQETIALGVCNILCPFAGGFAVSACLPRTRVQQATGGRSQLSTVISSVFVLAVVFYLAPYFQWLPKSLLACIILIWLKDYFALICDLIQLWKICKSDFLTWIFTFVFVVSFGPSIGLYSAIAFSIAQFIHTIKTPKYGTLGRLSDTNLYAFNKLFPQAREIDDIKIFKYSESISYTNKDAFRIKLFKSIGFNPTNIVNNEEKPTANGAIPTEGIQENGTSNHRVESHQAKKSLVGFSFLIFDTSMWSFIDSTSAREVLLISNKFNEIGVTTMLAGTSNAILDVLEGCGVFDKCIDRENVFVTLHDAVVCAEGLSSKRKAAAHSNGTVNIVSDVQNSGESNH